MLSSFTHTTRQTFDEELLLSKRLSQLALLHFRPHFSASMLQLALDFTTTQILHHTCPTTGAHLHPIRTRLRPCLALTTPRGAKLYLRPISRQETHIHISWGTEPTRFLP
ncbi:hypothetical protein T439DRAFT_183489 [Meredithblackwellia eburnea MCA 4105]